MALPRRASTDRQLTLHSIPSLRSFQMDVDISIDALVYTVRVITLSLQGMSVHDLFLIFWYRIHTFILFLSLFLYIR